MAKPRKHTRNIEIKRTPRLYKYNARMVQKVKPNTKKQYRRKWDKQNLSKNQDE
jgi:hypothetical protein